MNSTMGFSRVSLFLSWAGLAFGGLLLCYWLIMLAQQKRRIASLAKHNRFVAQSKASDTNINRWLKPVSHVFVTTQSDMAVRFTSAGFHNARWAQWFMPMKYGALLVGEAAVAGVCWLSEASLESWIAIAAAWAMVVIALPDIVLNSMAKSRQRRISHQMPYLIDLMAICVQTGMTIEASMKYLSIEMKSFDQELSSLLDSTNQRARLVGVENALEELYRKVPSPEVRSFVMTLTQSIQHGSSIYNVLTTLAGDIREVQMLELEEEIGKLAAKMSIPLIVFILIPIVFVIAAPGVMRMMLNV
ncbi:type II secretion system F family protein [uncultured Vibrio sp.]|uniref:type II secretion system F family protein n=1 Tax=uncultured Vibrio sp. TaxID=114054 RepID=UPI0009110EE7|nr:type II secretion system F family protein [uncultured Vibrio sp.]OIQ25101.1 MAG: biotin synthase [Vibrio sp. MedPE-SWchi]